MKHKGIIANPNCSTIIMSLGLKPLHDISPIKRVVVSTYQAVSGAGKEGIEELENQVKQYTAGEEMTANLLPTGSAPKHYPVAFNLLPQIDVFLENDYTKEEMKMVYETQKILHDETIQVVPTTVRVPVYRSHSESVLVETAEPVSVEAFKAACENSLVYKLKIILLNKFTLCHCIHLIKTTVKLVVFVKTYIMTKV